MCRKFIIILLFGMVLDTVSLLFGQAGASTASLKGLVADPTGAAVPGATITVADTSKGTARTAITNELGEYKIFLLPPSIYLVKVYKQGFSMQEARNIQITVGQVAVLNFQLVVGALKQTIEVSTSATPLIETERVQQSNTIEERYIRNLPIDRRDYLTFSLLMPGMADSNTVTDNVDYRPSHSPQSGLSSYGSNGRGNSITIDGSEANGRVLGVRATLSQEAVQEFQINRSNYSAEFGGASGAVINIVSKSGDNQLRGSIFGEQNAVDDL